MTRSINGIVRAGVVELIDESTLPPDGTSVQVIFDDSAAPVKVGSGRILRRGMFKKPGTISSTDDALRELRREQAAELEREFDEFFPRH